MPLLRHLHKCLYIYYGGGILFMVFVVTSDQYLVKQNCSPHLCVYRFTSYLTGMSQGFIYAK